MRSNRSLPILPNAATEQVGPTSVSNQQTAPSPRQSFLIRDFFSKGLPFPSDAGSSNTRRRDSPPVIVEHTGMLAKTSCPRQTNTRRPPSPHSSRRTHIVLPLCCFAQTHVDTGIARGVAQVGTRRQNAPLRDAAEVCVSFNATSRCTQVYRTVSVGAQSMDASNPRQHT